MINKLPKDLLAKLNDEDLEVIKNTFDTEAKNIREASTRGMIKKSEYDALQNDFNKFTKENKVNELLKDVPDELHDLFKDKLFNSDDLDGAFTELTEKHSSLIEKLKVNDEPARASELLETQSENKLDTLDSINSEKLANGIPFIK